MPYLIETWDKEGHQGRRLELRDAHLAFLDAHAARLLACGAKLDDAGEAASGGVYILDAETRDEAQSFIEDDPFHRGDLFARVEIHRWRKAYFDGRNTLDKA